MISNYLCGRIIAGAIVALFFCLGLYLGVGSFLEYQKVKRISELARVAEPIHLQVDFSTEGEHSGTFDQSCGFACTEMLRIETDAPFPSAEQALAAMEGVVGTVQITDADGTSIYEQEFTSKDFLTIAADGIINGFFPRLRFTPFKTGLYDFRLTVTEGAPALAGVPHALVARYVLCGVEFMATTLAALASLICFVIACATLLVITIVTRRERKKHSNQLLQPTRATQGVPRG